MIFDFFNKNKVKIDPEKELEGLLKAQELLNQRFEQKLMTNEAYLQRANDLRKKIEKCRKKISK